MIELSPIVTIPPYNFHPTFNSQAQLDWQAWGLMGNWIGINPDRSSKHCMTDHDCVTKSYKDFWWLLYTSWAASQWLTYWNLSVSVTLGDWGCDNKDSFQYWRHLESRKTKTSESSSKPTILHQQSPQTSPNNYWKWYCFRGLHYR